MEAPVVAAFRFALELAVKATLVFAATGVCLLLLRRRSASVRHAAGALGMAAALVVPLLSTVLPRVSVPVLPSFVALRDPAPPRAIRARAAVAPAAQPKAASAKLADRESWTPVERPPAARRAASVSAPSAAPAPARPRPRKITVILVREWAMAAGLAIWIAGALALLARLVVGILRVRRCRRTEECIESADWTDLTRKVGATLKVSTPIELFFVRDLPVAVTAGLRRPVLLLPETARGWDESRRRVVLLHEMAHVARRDWPALLLGEIAAAAYWVHPLAWVLARRLRRDGERAADDLVLASGTKPSVYAGHLLGIIRSLSPGSWRETLPAMGMARPSHFEERVRAILAPGMRRRRISRGQIGFGALAVLAGASLVAALQPWGPTCAGAKALDAPEPSAGAADRPADAKARRSAASPKAVSGGVPGGVAGGIRGGVAKGVPGGVAGGVSEGIAATTKEALVETIAGNAIDEEAPGKAASEEKSGPGWREYREATDLHEDGRYTEAAAAFARAYEEGYRRPVAAYNAACAWARAGNRDEAFRWLEKASAEGFRSTAHIPDDEDLASLQSDPRLPEILARLGKLEVEAARKSPEGEKAVRRFDELTRSAPENGEKLYANGKEMLKIGRYDLAERAFRLSARLGYRPGASLYNAACAFSRKGDREAALDMLQQALEAGFDDPKLVRTDDDLEGIRREPLYLELVELAEALELKADGSFPLNGKEKNAAAWRRAVPRYEKFAAAHPDLGRAWFNLGFASLTGGDAEKGRQAFERSLSLDYRRATNLYNIGCAEARLGNKDKAFESLFQALEAGFDGRGAIEHDDDLASLHGDPRFTKLVRRAEEHRAAK